MTEASSRQVNGVTIVDISGSITSEAGSLVLRNTVKDLSTQGSRDILLNLGQTEELDISGVGELVSAYTSVRNAGGELKLCNLTRAVHELLQITKLCAVFDIQYDEAAAIASFGPKTAAR